MHHRAMADLLLSLMGSLRSVLRTRADLVGARAEDLERCTGQAPEQWAHGGMMHEGDD